MFGSEPAASSEELLPGFSALSNFVTRVALRFRRRLFIVCFFALLFAPSEACMRLRRSATEEASVLTTTPDPLDAVAEEAKALDHVVQELQSNNIPAPLPTHKPVTLEFDDPSPSEEDRLCPNVPRYQLSCHNGGLCVMRYNHVNEVYEPSCNCAYGWEGALCDIIYDEQRHLAIVHAVAQAVYSTVSYSALSFFLCMVIITVVVAVYAYRRVSRQMLEESHWWEPTSTGTNSSSLRTPYASRHQSLRLPRAKSSVRGGRGRGFNDSCTDIIERVPDSFFRKHSTIPGRSSVLSTPRRSDAIRINISSRECSSIRPPLPRLETFVDETGASRL